MKVAVFLEQDIQAGGGFQQALSTLLLLKELESSQLQFAVFTDNKANLPVLKSYGFDAHYFRFGLCQRVLMLLRRCFYWRRLIVSLPACKQNALDKLLHRHQIDLVYFTSPSSWALDLEDFNYIYTLWDLAHRDQMEFPEVRQNREFERREQLFRAVLPKATAILVDSAIGKLNASHRYGLDSERIWALPFLPSAQLYKESAVDIKKKYAIDGDYIYYPAQFWPHKNHVYIVDALALLKQAFQKKLHVIFSGSNKGNLAYLLDYAKEKKVAEQVHYIGFAPSEELADLYKQSLALVMPTYFGPTNIPPLEAFALEVPVFYSDLPDLREQVEGTAILMNLRDPESLACSLNELILGKIDIKTLCQNGKNRLAKRRENNLEMLNLIFENYQIKAKCWARDW
ncbi:MAG: mannosyltransferase [Gammaproteobacteria bacterium]|jgi:glycosyltransferase involved in cell wall biosynthesis|nr:mannosyltransferase [Gammaproteobacteria bacterium]